MSTEMTVAVTGGGLGGWLARIGSRFLELLFPDNANRRRNVTLLTTLGLGIVVYLSYNHKRKNSVHNYKVHLEERPAVNSPAGSRQQRHVPKISTTAPYLRSPNAVHMTSNSSSASINRMRNYKARDRNTTSASSALAANPPQIRTTPQRATRHQPLIYDDAASNLSDDRYTSVSQQNYYNCQTEMVRFRVPESTYAGSQVSDIDDMHPEARQELHDCMVGIERLLESAQIAIDAPSCKSSLIGSSMLAGLSARGLGNNRQGSLDTPPVSERCGSQMMHSSSTLTNHGHTADSLAMLRQDVIEIKERCRAIARSRHNSMVASLGHQSDGVQQASVDDVEFCMDIVQPTHQRIRAQASISAMSCLSDATDGWFSCISGESTPRNLTPAPSIDDLDYVEVTLSENTAYTEPLAFPEPRRVSSTGDIHRRFYIYDQIMSQGPENILFRKDRTAICRCRSLEDFQVKVAILRNAFDHLLRDVQGLGEFLCQAGRFILTGILVAADKVPGDMQMAYDAFVQFASYTDPEQQLEEIRHRKVRQFNFFDIIIDYILLDAFTDLENPPQTVKSVLTNRWLGDRFKETALQTAVWSIIKAKKGRVKVKNGFLFHYYSLWECVSPVLAWGFMGPKHMCLATICDNVYRNVLGFIEDMFSFDVMDYSSQSNFERKLCAACLRRFQRCVQLVHDGVGGMDVPEELQGAMREVETAVKYL